MGIKKYKRADPDKPLNEQERLLVQHYLKTLNITEAAIAAGYAETTAKTRATQWISPHSPKHQQKPHLMKAIAEAMEKREERVRLDADWVLKRLHEEAVADIADLYAPDGSLLPVHDWPLIWRQGLISAFGVDEQEFINSNGEVFKTSSTSQIKLSDRLKRIELIGRHTDIKAFADRLEDGPGTGGSADTSPISEVERAQRMAAIMGALPDANSG